MGPPQPGPQSKGAHGTGSFTSRAGKGHKMLWSQTRDPGHFSKSWEIQDFFLGGGVGGKKKEKKREKTFHGAASSPFHFLVPGHGLETPRAARGDVLPSVHRGLLCLSQALSALGQAELSGPLPAYLPNGSKGPKTSKRGPFQLCFSTSLDLSRAGAGFQWSC